jgi:hypothetical protein
MEVNCKTDLDSVQTSTSAKFCLKIQAPSPSLYVADTLKLTLFTDQGDSIRVNVVETGVYSKQYIYKGNFYFVEDSASLEDSHLDAVLNLDTTYNRVVIQGGVKSDKSKLKKRDSLVVYTKYAPADIAEIYDRDLDGRADSVRIHFKKALKKKIASIDTVFWNVAQGAWTDVDSKKIRIVGDSTWVEARVRKAFKYGLTAPDTSAPPYLRVTKEESEFSQKALLVDRVGAVPVKAVKRPARFRWRNTWTLRKTWPQIPWLSRCRKVSRIRARKPRGRTCSAIRRLARTLFTVQSVQSSIRLSIQRERSGSLCLRITPS